MRRLAIAMPLLAVPLAAAACGGSKGGSSGNTTLPENPAAAVTGAADKTAQAGSEHVRLVGRIVSSGTTIMFTGAGDFDSKKKLGSLSGTFSAGGLSGALDEVSSGASAYVKSALLSAFVPGGKTWLRLDLAKVAKSQGIDIGSFFSQDPARALAKLKGLKQLRKVGAATVAGESATHYTGAVDVPAASGGAASGTGRYDVWIGEDGYVHRVKAIITTGGTTSTLTTDLSAFGKSVSVEIPKAADTFDATNASIPGLGG
jgi:hypothetical protein